MKKLSKVAVTGGAGFIGSHVVETLTQQGQDVIVIDTLEHGYKHNIPSTVPIFQVDIRSEELSKIFESEKPDYVIHLAAQISVGASFYNPVYDADTNISGTIHVLQNCHQHGVKKVLFASSAAVYGTPKSLPIREDHTLTPMAPYGLSKLTCEHYIRLLGDFWNLNYTILRFSNVFGPRQNSKGEAGVISIFAEKLLKNEAPIIYAGGEQTRDFVYVKDVAKATVAALSSTEKSTINISTGVPTSVNHLFDLMTDILGVSIQPTHMDALEIVNHSVLDNSQAKIELHWEPHYDLVSGLREMLKDEMKKVHN